MCIVVAALLSVCCLFATSGNAYAEKSTSSSSAQTAKQTSKSSSENASSSSSSNGKSMAPGTSEPTSSKKDDDDKAKDDKKKKEEEKEKKEKEEKKEKAAEKRSQAGVASAQAAEMQAQMDKFQGDYDRAAGERDEAAALRDETKAELEQENEALESLREDVSDYVVDMYKQGGSAPYLDVMLRSTSYHEFLTSWYMANEVGSYGKVAMKQKNQVINELQATIDSYNKQIEDIEHSMKLAEAQKRQANVSRLAFLAQAASLNAEAADIMGDSEAAAKAAAESERLTSEMEDVIKQGVAGDSLLSGTGYFTHPCPDATYSSGFGYRSFDHSFHKGLDMAIAEGTPYYAADSGTVTAATNGGGYNGGAGNWVVIDHGNGLVTKYMHSLVTFVTVGQHVERGQNIGLVGNTGNSFGAHLHFQVEVNGAAVNPVLYL